MSTLYRAGDVVQPASAHDPALSGIVADVIAAESQPCSDGRAREIVTVRVRGTGFVAQLEAGELAPAPLRHWTEPS